MERKSNLHFDISTRIEDENRAKTSEQESVHGFPGEKFHVTPWHEPYDSDDEEDTFSVENSWKMLFQLPSCHQIMIQEKTQKRLQIFVGVNVSQEFPWKQIKYKQLREHLIDEVENAAQLFDSFQGYGPEHHVLIGYAPLLTQNQDDVPEGDPFVLYSCPDDAKTALNIIKNIEMYERWKLNKRLVKKPHRWVSLNSEDEVNLTLQQRFTDDVNVEIQSVYPPTIPMSKEFTFRLSSDARDGYVELLPAESAKFENIFRRRVNIGIQSGAPRVNLEQQTDPTFPTNAWAQYLYEINEGDEGLDESSEEEEKEQQPVSRVSTPVAEEQKASSPPEMSDQIKLLLKTLEFNQVDMYRNDYPLISERQVDHYTNPYLEETLCFANISKSYHRFVCSTDWYPILSGLIVTSYTFTTPATVDQVSHKVDTVQRAVLQPNPILMWSFADNLNYKLEFESPLEVTTLSFCPYKPNLLFGGAKNGQIIIWDLLNRVQKLDYEEILTSAQSRYRTMIADFLKWTITINEDATVSPATATSLEVSQKGAITGIYWMGHAYYVNTYGKVYRDPDPKAKHTYFITSSIDCTITFWNLDSASDKKGSGQSRSSRIQPKALMQSESPYKNKILKPVFTVAFNEPITAIIADTSVFSCLPKEPAKKRTNPLNYGTTVTATDPDSMRQSVITSSFYGRIERLNWLGLYADADGRECVSSSMNFARVHDGPVISMRKNPFYPNIFASIGRNVFGVWKEDYNYSPIFWRKRPCDLTSVAWSEDRPAVLFLTRIDGCLEAWDILSRDDDACLSDILGGGIVTTISEHRPSEPEKLLGIGDYNSSFRMVKLPRSFYVPLPNELESVRTYIEQEQSRKKSIQAWEQKYYDNNREEIEAKRQAESDTRKEMERIEKEEALNAARKALEEAEEIKKASQQPTHMTYTEKMRRKWDELNMNRLMSILMSRKRVDAEQLERETALEKKRLNYEAAKKQSLLNTLQRVGEEVAAVRSRILPAEKPDLLRNDMIISTVDNLMANVENYNEIEEEANSIIYGFSNFDDIDYIEFLRRGEHRRQMLNKSLGGNTERWFWYEAMRMDGLLSECNWGYEYFMSANADFLLSRDAKLSNLQSDPIESSDVITNASVDY